MFQASFRLVFLFAALALGACATAPPVQEMSDARQAISAAVEAHAKDYAPDSLGDARHYLQTAEDQIHRRAYGPARLNALRAKNHALDALETSQHAVKTVGAAQND